MKKEFTSFLHDIIDCCKMIELYILNENKNSFELDIKLQDAVIRRLEIIGEAVKSIPHEYKDQYPHIAWKTAAGMRDILIHAYNDADLDVIWETAIESLPKFKKQIENLPEIRIG